MTSWLLLHTTAALVSGLVGYALVCLCPPERC